MAKEHVRVLVTGAGGFIGSHVVERLGAAGHSVVALDAALPDLYSSEPKRRNLARMSSFDFVDAVIHDDLRTASLEPVLEGVDAVINEAAIPGLAKSWSHLQTYVDCNVVALHRLLDACQRVGVQRFIHASTSSVYGRFAEGDESAPLNPCSPYGVTKVAAENLITAYADNFEFDSIILRYFSAYGPRQRPDMGYHIFCEKLLDDEEISIFGDGKSIRANTYVEDIADATYLALERGIGGSVYNIAGSRSVSPLDAIGILAATLGKEPRLKFCAPRPGDQSVTAGDSSRAFADLGWSPRVPFEVGLRNQAQWQLASRS